METQVGGWWKEGEHFRQKDRKNSIVVSEEAENCLCARKFPPQHQTRKSVKFAFSWLLNSSNWDGEILGGDGFSTAANFTTFNSLINNFNTFEGNWKFLTHAAAPVSLVNRRLVNLLTILTSSTLCGSARLFSRILQNYHRVLTFQTRVEFRSFQ